MKRHLLRIVLCGLCVLLLSCCFIGCYDPTVETETVREVQRQQAQYVIGQPIPRFDWSLERDLVIQLYRLRNEKVSTHTVWRSDYGKIEGDCPSVGYGIPYDTSLTNPLMATNRSENGVRGSLTTIEQAEPNGIFASKNTSATWAMCISDDGVFVEPHYIESKVTVYPYPVTVDYATNRITRIGSESVKFRMTTK